MLGSGGRQVAVTPRLGIDRNLIMAIRSDSASDILLKNGMTLGLILDI